MANHLHYLQKTNLAQMSHITISSSVWKIFILYSKEKKTHLYFWKHIELLFDTMFEENVWFNRRGCQPPWLYNPEDNNILTPCHNLTHMKEWFARGEKGGKSFEYFHWHSNTPSELQMKTGCPQPCKVATFKWWHIKLCILIVDQLNDFQLRPKFSYSSLQRHAYMGTDGDSEWVIHLAFDSFAFTYEREYLLCDWTCLLGEIGGNLGLFLGGSLLGFVDLIIEWGRKRVNWFKNLK